MGGFEFGADEIGAAEVFEGAGEGFVVGEACGFMLCEGVEEELFF